MLKVVCLWSWWRSSDVKWSEVKCGVVYRKVKGEWWKVYRRYVELREDVAEVDGEGLGDDVIEVDGGGI